MDSSSKKQQQDEEDENEQKQQQEKTDEERQQALQLIAEIDEKTRLKAEFRKSNQDAVNNRPDESFFRKLDSSLKKNTAFVKKIGKLTEQQRASLSNELKGLNLTRYIQEIASTLFQSKIKMSDIPCSVHICSLMHQRYSDFTPILYQTAKKVFQGYQDDKASMVTNGNKVRTDMRFVSELTVAGIFSDKEGLTLIHSLLCVMTSHDKDKHELLTIIISLCKHNGEDLAGLVSRKSKMLGNKFGLDIPKSLVFAADKQKIFYNVLRDYWQTVRDHMVTLHKGVRAVERRNQQILHSKGELHDDKSKEFADKHAVFLKLQFNANTLADLLDVDVPDFHDIETSVNDPDSAVVCRDATTPGGEVINEESMWEDDDQKSFYTNLLDLQAIIPAILFKDGGNKSKKASGTGYNKAQHRKRGPAVVERKPVGPKQGGKGETALEGLGKDIEDIEMTEREEMDLTAVQKANEAAAAKAEKEKLQKEAGEDSQSDEDTEKGITSMEDDTEDDDLNMGATMKVIVETYITSLKNCVNRELLDKAAQDFCMNMNTRPNRKRLARALFNVHRSRLDLLPFYARLTATLHPCIPDVAEQLSTMLLRDFRFHMRKKEQIHIESKVKTMRFIGEMTKFGMISLTDCLNCLKALILEFSPHAIEMACGLLETCGYYALRHTSSHLRARVLLEQLLRKQAAKALDQRYSTMIDNARYTCDPPKTEAVVYKPRPKMHEYIRKLLFRDLSKSTVEKVLRQMRKLPWSEKDTRMYILKCLGQSWMIKYNNIHCLASLVAGLVNHRDDVGHFVVDDVLEDIRVGMEINKPKYNQRRVSSVKFLGELYNYRMVESSLIFNVLYSFITFGVVHDVSRPSPLDPPDHLFRIRLVCVLLETCGNYFDRGSSKKRLDCFIPYFQRYIWMKKTHPYWTFNINTGNTASSSSTTDNSSGERKTEAPPPTNTAVNPRLFPVEVDYLVQDTLEPLRPKLRLASTWDEMIASVAEIERDMMSKLSKVLPTDKVHGLGELHTVTPSSGGGKNLVTIPESNEAEPSDKKSDAHDQSIDEDDDEDDEDEDDDDDDDEDDDDATMSGGDAPPSGDCSPSRGAKGAGTVEDLDRGDTQSCHSGTSLVGPKHFACSEDTEFMRAFDNLLVESIQSRKQAQVQQQDMSVPINARKNMQMNMNNQRSSGGNSAPKHFPMTAATAAKHKQGGGGPPVKESSICFALLTRKGNKPTLQPLKIPVTEQFASGLRDRTQAEIKQKQELKQITLSINERQVEEEQHMLDTAYYAKQPLANMNRERRPKYQPPKGAPNADLIFNSGGRRR